MLRGLDLELFSEISVSGQSGVISISNYTGLDKDIVAGFIERFGELMNPLRQDKEGDQWKLRMMDPAMWRDHSEESIERKNAKDLLKRCKNALFSLLRRGPDGPEAGEDLQTNLRRLRMVETGPDGRAEFETKLYQGVHSMLADEPRINVTGNDQIRRTFIARRYQEQGSRTKELLDAADLRSFPGNILLLSPMTQNLHQNYSQDWGLKENKNNPLWTEIENMLKKDRLWGSDDHLILHEVMIASDQFLDLKIHKYHALLIAALDWALAEALSMEAANDE
jgi:hypothetical protein